MLAMNHVQPVPISMCPQLQGLEQFEEDLDYCQIRDMVAPVSVVIEPCPYLAAIKLDERRIVLDPSLFEDKVGEIYPKALQYYLFELSNLAQADKIEALFDRSDRITPDEFVETCERIEHQSVLNTKKILRRSLPREQWMHYPLIYSTDRFDLHYLIQQTAGHSLRIWDRYRFLFPEASSYTGTWSSVPEDERRPLMALIDLKGRLSDPDESIATQANKDYHFLKDYFLSHPNADLRNRLARRIELLD